MTFVRIEAYLSHLQHELRERGLVEARIIDEVREHLVDAVEAAMRRGLSAEAAEREALVRFGPPETIAAAFLRTRHPMLKRLAVVMWRLGRVLRRNPPHLLHYHDHDLEAPARYHFALRLKRPFRNLFGKMSTDEQKRFIAQKRERGEDVSAFETDPRERLVQFLAEFGRRTFGSSGSLESLTLLEDTSDSTTRRGRYLASFGSGVRMIWVVALRADGGVSFDGTNSPA